MKTDHIKRRGVWPQIALVFVTFGIYQLYWFFVTVRELHIANDTGLDAGVWVLFLYLPVVNWFVGWHYAGEVEKFTDGRYPRVVLMLIWILPFVPVVYYIAQKELNNASTAPE